MIYIHIYIYHEGMLILYLFYVLAKYWSILKLNCLLFVIDEEKNYDRQTQMSNFLFFTMMVNKKIGNILKS